MKHAKFLYPLFLPALLSGFLLYSAYAEVRQKTIDQLNNQQTILAKEAARGIEAFFDHYARLLNALTNVDSIISLDDQGKNLMEVFYRSHAGEITSITLMDADGHIAHSVPSVPGLIGTDLSERVFVRRMMKTLRPIVSDVFMSARGSAGVAFHVPILQDDVFRGSLSVLIPFDHLARKHLEGIKLAEDGYAWMMSRDGVELYCPVPGHVGRNVYENCWAFPTILSMADEMVQGKEGITTYLFDRVRGETVESVEKHAVYLPIHLPDNYWSIVVATPESEVLGIIQGFRNRFFLLAGIMLLTSVLGSYYLGRAFMIVKEEAKRKRVEERLRESEAKYRTLFESATAAIFLIRDNMFINCNNAALKMYGATREELVGSNPHVYSPLFQPDGKDSREETNMRLTDALAGMAQTFEWRHCRHDGSPFDAEVVLNRLDLGEETLVLGIVRDITSRKQAEKALKESAWFQQQLIDALPVPVFYKDSEGRYLGCNSAFESFLNVSKDRIIGNVAFDIAPRELADVYQEKDEALLGDPGIQIYESSVRDSNGLVHNVVFHKATFSRPDGSVGGLIGAILDITERKRAEEKLKDSEQQLQSIIQGNPIPAFVIDKDHRVICWNKALEEMSKTKASEVAGTNLHWKAFYGTARPCMADLLVDEVGPDEISLWYSGLSNKSSLIEEAYEATDFFPELGEDGKWLHFTAAAIRNSQGIVVSAIETLVDVTARKRAEEALVSANLQLNDIIEFLPDATAVFDRDKKVIAWNRAMEEMTGVSKKEMIGKGDYACTVPFYGERRPHLLDLIDAPEAELESKYQHVTRKGGILHAETHVPCVYGGLGAYVLATGAPLFDAHGNRVGAIESIRDITEQKLAREALAQSEGKYRELVQNANSIILRMDKLGNVTFMNEFAQRFFGYGEEEILGKNVIGTIVPPVETTGRDLRLMIEDIAQNPDRYSSNVNENMRRGGEKVWIAWTNKPIRYENGRVMEVLCVGNDITERKLMEEAVAEAEAKYRGIFENSLMGIFQTTPEGRFISLNMALARIFGYDSPEQVMNEIRDIPRQLYVNPDRRSELLRLIEERGMVQEFVVRFFRKDGSIAWITLNIRAVRDLDGKITHLEGIAQDITESKMLASRLNQAQKMEAIGTLAGGIAHDFNNILAPILGYSELSLSVVPKNSRLHHNIEQILLSGIRARDLVKQILTFSRKAEHERRPVQVSLLIKETLKLLRSSLPSTIEIRQDLDEDAIDTTVLADPIHIHQVLMNLCTNAAHAMRATGGVLSITLKSVDIGSAGITELPDLDPGSYLRLTVADTGHGIDEAVRQRIFEPYFTTKGPSEGTGLGLALIYGIVKNLSGAIAVSSKPGEGATFDVYFPRTKTLETPLVDLSVPLPTGKGLVLVVDDEKSIVDLLNGMLTSLGYDVAERYSSYDALQAFRARPHSYDLVITDQTMPHMTGIDLAREILKIRANTPIILCTGFSEAVDENKTKHMGIKGFLMKPVTLRDLALTVHKILFQD